MNDVLLYTYPQKDGKYRLKNTLAVSGMKVTPPLYYLLQLELHSGLLVSPSKEKEGMYLLSRNSLVSYRRQKEK